MRGIVLGSLFVLGAAALSLGSANSEAGAAEQAARGLPLAECDPRQPTYNGRLTLDGQPVTLGGLLVFVGIAFVLTGLTAAVLLLRTVTSPW